jgi:hypothetical protein
MKASVTPAGWLANPSIPAYPIANGPHGICDFWTALFAGRRPRSSSSRKFAGHRKTRFANHFLFTA